MKYLLWTTLILTVACGRYDLEGSRLGEHRSFEPLTVSGLEKNRIQQICQVLSQKAQLISQGTSEVFPFDVAQKSCDEDKMSPHVRVNVNVEISSGAYRLRRTDNGALFIYPDLETHQSGIMKEICGKENLTSPLKLANGNALWFSTSGISGADCSPASNEQCLMIETGTPSGTGFKITTKEWIKFQMDPQRPRLGFFTQRRTLSGGLCSVNSFIQTEAVLK